MTARKQQITILFLFMYCMVFGQKPTLVKTVARPGDGVYSLLRFYGLEKQKCNIDQFYILNGLSTKSHLKANTVYYLPLYSYSYNGKSIRSTVGDSNMDKAKRIQAYNEKMLASKFIAKSYRDTKVLWVPLHELGCKGVDTSNQKPPVIPPPVTSTPANIDGSLNVVDPKSRVYPIFGKKYQQVPLVSSKLKNSVYYIVSGHGGPDPGAIGKAINGKTMCEDEYAYDVSLRLARNLIRQGGTVYVITRDPDDGIRSGEILSCDNDERCWKNQVIPLNVKERLAQRSNSINKLYEYHKKQGVINQTAVMIHVDSRSVKEQVDLFFYHFPESKSGKKLATTLFETMEHQYKKNRPSGQYDGSVSARDLFMLRETKPTAVYVEMGNIQNRNDQKRFTEEGNRQALANWLELGLLKAVLKK